MKLFFITSFVFFVLFFSPALVFSQERLAECDQCGYCRESVKPGNWEKCAACLYPQVTPATDPNGTLKVVPLAGNENPDYARAVTPAPGRYYTQLGCINTNLNTFQDPGAAGGLLNFLLTRLIFPVAGVLGFLAILYGAFLLITAQGSPNQIQVGKNYVMGAIIGLIFVFSSILLVSLIGGDILRIPWLTGNRINADLAKLRNAIVKMQNDTKKLPFGHNTPDLNACAEFNDEIFLTDACNVGLLSNCGGIFPNWNGSYIDELPIDPWNRPYRFDPDYYCRPDVKGCQNVNYGPSDKDPIGSVKKVRAVHTLGKDGINNDYCPGGTAGCTRYDKDNVVLVICETT